MADTKLHASSDLFKQLSQELEQLKLTAHYLETFANRAKDGRDGLEDRKLILIHEQLEAFVLNANRLADRLESLLVKLVVPDEV